jgi:hypothetical protein
MLVPPIFALMQKRVEPKKIKAWAKPPFQRYRNALQGFGLI